MSSEKATRKNKIKPEAFKRGKIVNPNPHLNLHSNKHDPSRQMINGEEDIPLQKDRFPNE